MERGSAGGMLSAERRGQSAGGARRETNRAQREECFAAVEPQMVQIEIFFELKSVSNEIESCCEVSKKKGFNLILRLNRNGSGFSVSKTKSNVLSLSCMRLFLDINRD